MTLTLFENILSSSSLRICKVEITTSINIIDYHTKFKEFVDSCLKEEKYIIVYLDRKVILKL